MEKLAVLCDIVGEHGGAERYWATVLPELQQRYETLLFARAVESHWTGVPQATPIACSDENSEPSEAAAARVREALAGCDVVVTANVFDSSVLEAVRASASRWIARIHDHRAFCPNGNKVFPQFAAVCTAPMGAACTVNSALRGCIHGPRRSSLEIISRRLRTRDAIAGADAVLVSSEYMRGLCVQNGIPANIIHITPPPLADDFFTGPTVPSGHDVLFFGRATLEKGLRSLIAAIGNIDRVVRPRLKVASRLTVTETDLLQTLAAKHGVDLQLLGWLSQAALRNAIDSAYIVALPSLWPEPFGLSGTQALARSRPVVAYDVGGVAEWIDGGGIAVPRADAHALGEAITKLCSDGDLWSRLSSGARENAQRYRLDRHMRMLCELLSAREGRRIA